MIFSIYNNFVFGSGNTATIKFGSYDEDDLAAGESLTVLRTINSTTWALKTVSQTVGGKDMTSSNTQIIFDPQFQYLYMPSADYL